MTILLGNSAATGTATALFARAFAFIATETGLLEELQLLTSAESNPGVTSLRLGVFATSIYEGREVPGNVIQEGTYTGTPDTNTWITVTGLTIPILKSTKYWLVVLPLGGALNYSAYGSVGSALEFTEEREELYRCSEGGWGPAQYEVLAEIRGLGKAGVGTEREILFGVNGGPTDNGHASTWTSHKVIVGRSVEVEYTETPATVSTHVGEMLALGIIKPIVLVETPPGTVLSDIDTSAFADGVAAIVKKVTEDHSSAPAFELINEPYYRGPHNVLGFRTFCVLKPCVALGSGVVGRGPA